MTQEARSITLEEVLAPFRKGSPGAVLGALHAVQEHFGWVSPEAVEAVARALGLTRNQVWGIVTFYSDFRTQPPPPFVVGLCHGPTCHIYGAEIVQDLLERRWNVRQDVPNPQGPVELRLIQCSGLCHLAIWLTVNGRTIAHVTPENLAEKLREHGLP
jgi:NADH:ubiquinone oxidoreductase subunit E